MLISKPNLGIIPESIGSGTRAGAIVELILLFEIGLSCGKFKKWVAIEPDLCNYTRFFRNLFFVLLLYMTKTYQWTIFIS